MRSRRRRRAKRRSSGGGWRIFAGLGLILVVISIFTLIGFMYVSATKNYVALNPDNHCPEDKFLNHLTVLVMDTTDSLNRAQKSSVKNVVEKLVSSTPRYGALAIYAVSPDEQRQSQSIFYRCNPGRKNEIDPKFANPAKIEQEWKEGFHLPLNETLEKNLESGGANSSPIMESIQWVAIQEFGPLADADTPLKLVVISDFLQHTTGYSHYRVNPNFSSFENSQYYRKVKANLQDAQIELWFVRRNTGRQDSSLENFWRTYFQAQGAKSVSIEHLVG